MRIRFRYPIIAVVISVGSFFSFANHGLFSYFIHAEEERAIVVQIPNALPPRAPASVVQNDPIPPGICRHIYRTVCRKKTEGKDFTGTVGSDFSGEEQATQIEEAIQEQHQNWSDDQVTEELIAQIYSPKRVARFQAAYKWVEHKVEKWIEGQPDAVLSTREKKILKFRIRHTQLELPPAVRYTDSPDIYTKSDVFYERTSDGHMRMRVGGAYLLSVKSWFNMLFTLGHELGHAIDPCEIRALRIFIPAYDRLTGCFLEKGFVAITPQRTECGENDQLSEVFADWLGVKIMDEGIKSYATEFHGQQLEYAALNSVRDLCDDDDNDLLINDFHPPARLRIERIFGESPEIQTMLGCPKPEHPIAYCEFE